MVKKNNQQQLMKQASRDPMWFLWFLSVVVILIYVLVLVETPQLRQMIFLIPFTFLTAAHIVLHWRLINILEKEKPKYVYLYIIVQGAIAFALVILSKSLILPIAIFMGLIGEGVGVYGLSLRSVLSTTYYLVLAFTGLLFIPNSGSLWGWALGLVPILFFVIMYVILYQRQLEAREEAQYLLAKLENANQQLSEYAVRVEDLTIVAERQRMARDLHDTLSQGLAGLILQLEAAEAQLSNQKYDKVGEIIRNSMEQARDTLSGARQTIGVLRGEAKIRMDFEEMVQEEINRFVKTCPVKYELFGDLKGEYSNHFQDVMQRVLSEGLSNIARHAGAAFVTIEVKQTEDEIMLEISDDGCGFNPDNVLSGHYGLLGMRERVSLIGGEIFIKSKAGEGTTISVKVPKEKAYGSN